MSEIESAGPAVTPEDPQRRELPAELIQSVAAAVHRATCLTGCTDEPSERHVLIAATAIEAAVAAGLLDHLLTSQGYEHSEEVGWETAAWLVDEGSDYKITPQLQRGDTTTHRREVWSSPWTPIGGNQS